MTKYKISETGKRYKHYKGGEYEVTGFALHTETAEKMILYKPLHQCEDLESDYPEGVLFTRPYSIFYEKVEYEGKIIPRFKQML